MSEWRKVKLGEVSHYKKGINYTSSSYSTEENGYPFITIKCFIKGGGYAPTGLKFYNGLFTETDKLLKNDIIFAVTDLTRAGDIVGSPLRIPDFGFENFSLASMDCMKIEPIKNMCDNDFLYFSMMLSNVRRQMVAYSAGSTVLHLDTKQVPKIKIDLPEKLSVQKKIATILSSIDKTIERTEALIAKYQQIKAGMMQDLFTRGLLPDGTLRPSRDKAPELYKESAIGWIPKEWDCSFLDRLALRGSGHTPNKNISEYWNGGIKWISLADSYRLDKLYISDTDFEISSKGINNSSAILHPPGIVVLSRDAGIGKSAITTESMAVSQHFMCWKCSEKLDNYFLYYWMQYNKRTFENIAMGSTILTIGLQYFKKLKLIYPVGLKEQESISNKLLQTDQYIFSLQNDVKKKINQKSGLMHDLLTGNVRVTLKDEAS